MKSSIDTLASVHDRCSFGKIPVSRASSGVSELRLMRENRGLEGAQHEVEDAPVAEVFHFDGGVDPGHNR